MRFTAFVVVFVFTVTSVTWTTPVSAAPTDVAAPVVSSIDKLAIPAEMGSIQKMFLGTRTSGLETTRNPNESLATNPEPRHDRMVVLIQDAHAVIDAQENIAKILGHLQKNYGIRLAALEGAKGRLEPVLLRTFPEPDVKHKILTGYEQRAELSGPEMAAILQEEVGEYHGMEDWGLYAKNYFAYLRAQEKKEALLSRWNAFKRTLDTERAKVYDSKLNEFQEAREDFLTDRAALLDLLVYLSKFQNLFKTASGYQELPGLIASIGYEKSGKQDALVPHVRKIVDEFKMKYLRGLGVKTEMNFYNRYQAFLTGQITAGQMLQYLVQVGSENGKSVKLTPDLKKLLGHAELLSEIKGSRLCDELQRFLPAVEASLLKTPAQREMAEKYQKLYLLKEMIELELTHESLAEYQKEPDSYLSLITDSAFKQDFVPVAEFYQAALERDQAFMGRIETMMKDAKQKTVAVVAGGFHTNGLEHILREKGMAYAVVTPKIASLAGSENYAKVMKGEVSFKDYLKTTYFDALMRHSAKALVEALPIPDRVRTLKTWRDNVIRELAREGRITEAGKYLPYIDEILQSMPEAATAIGPRRTREEILDIVRKELGGFKKDSLDRIWKTFEFQLDIFTDGLKQLIAKKDLNTQSVSALLDRASQTKPSFIALQKALEFDEEPVFAEASVTKSDATEPAGTARAELPIQTEPSQDVLRGKGDKITLLVRDHIATAVNSLVKSKAGSNVSEVKVLEMGIGSGVLTAELARTTNGAEFTGVDVNPGAVQMARQALGKYKNVSVLESDLFLAFRKGEKFDVIFWNPPWSAKKGGGALALAKSDPGFSTLGRFLDKAPTFLKPGGRVFLIMPPNAMKKIWDKADALYDIKVNGFETTKNRDIGIYELTPKRSQTSTATEPAKLTRAETRRLESEGEMNAHERLFSTIATIVARGFIAALPLSPFFVSSWLPHTALMTAGHPSFTALRTTLQAVSILLAVPAVLVMASTFANILSDLYAMFRGVEEGSPVERARRLLAEMKKDADPELRDILSVINDTEGHPGFIVQKPAPLDDAFTAKREIIISESISRYPAMLRYITLRRAADLDWVIGTIIAGEPLYEFDRLTFVNNVIYRYAGNNMFHVKLMNALGAGLDFAKVAIQRFFTGRMPETVLRDGKGPLRGARLEAFKKELIKDFVKTKASEASSAPAARAETLAALAAIGATIIKTKSFDQIPESAGEIILAAAREDLKRPDFRPNGLAEVLISMVPGKDGGESFYVIAPGSSKGVKNIHQVMLEAAGLSGHKEELIRGSFYFYVEGTPKKIGKLGRIFFVPGIQNEVVPDNRRKLNDLQQLAYFEQLAYFFRTALSRADEAQVRYTSETLNAVVVALPSVRIMSQIKPTAEGYVTLGQLAEAYMLSKTPGAKVLAAAAEATKPIGIVRSELRTASKDQVITPRAKVTEMKIKETGFSKSLRSAFRNLFLPIILAASMFFGSVTQSLGWNLQRDDRRASEEEWYVGIKVTHPWGGESWKDSRRSTSEKFEMDWPQRFGLAGVCAVGNALLHQQDKEVRNVLSYDAVEAMGLSVSDGIGIRIPNDGIGIDLRFSLRNNLIRGDDPLSRYKLGLGRIEVANLSSTYTRYTVGNAGNRNAADAVVEHGKPYRISLDRDISYGITHAIQEIQNVGPKAWQDWYDSKGSSHGAGRPEVRTSASRSELRIFAKEKFQELVPLGIKLDGAVHSELEDFLLGNMQPIHSAGGVMTPFASPAAPKRASTAEIPRVSEKTAMKETPAIVRPAVIATSVAAVPQKNLSAAASMIPSETIGAAVASAGTQPSTAEVAAQIKDLRHVLEQMDQNQNLRIFSQVLGGDPNADFESKIEILSQVSFDEFLAHIARLLGVLPQVFIDAAKENQIPLEVFVTVVLQKTDFKSDAVKMNENSTIDVGVCLIDLQAANLPKYLKMAIQRKILPADTPVPFQLNKKDQRKALIQHLLNPETNVRYEALMFADSVRTSQNIVSRLVRVHGVQNGLLGMGTDLLGIRDVLGAFFAASKVGKRDISTKAKVAAFRDKYSKTFPDGAYGPDTMRYLWLLGSLADSTGPRTVTAASGNLSDVKKGSAFLASEKEIRTAAVRAASSEKTAVRAAVRDGRTTESKAPGVAKALKTLASDEQEIAGQSLQTAVKRPEIPFVVISTKAEGEGKTRAEVKVRPQAAAVSPVVPAQASQKTEIITKELPTEKPGKVVDAVTERGAEKVRSDLSLKTEARQAEVRIDQNLLRSATVGDANWIAELALKAGPDEVKRVLAAKCRFLLAEWQGDEMFEVRMNDLVTRIQGLKDNELEAPFLTQTLPQFIMEIFGDFGMTNEKAAGIAAKVVAVTEKAAPTAALTELKPANIVWDSAALAAMVREREMLRKSMDQLPIDMQRSYSLMTCLDTGSKKDAGTEKILNMLSEFPWVRLMPLFEKGKRGFFGRVWEGVAQVVSPVGFRGNDAQFAAARAIKGNEDSVLCLWFQNLGVKLGTFALTAEVENITTEELRDLAIEVARAAILIFMAQDKKTQQAIIKHPEQILPLLRQYGILSCVKIGKNGQLFVDIDALTNYFATRQFFESAA